MAKNNLILKVIDWYLARKGMRRGFVGDAWDWVPVGVQRLTSEALLLAKAQEGKPAASGEHKRREVYTQMIKNHPEALHRNIGWAIERAIRFLYKEA